MAGSFKQRFAVSAMLAMVSTIGTIVGPAKFILTLSSSIVLGPCSRFIIFALLCTKSSEADKMAKATTAIPCKGSRAVHADSASRVVPPVGGDADEGRDATPVTTTGRPGR